MPLEQPASVNGYDDTDYLAQLKDKIEVYEKISKYLSLVDLKQKVEA